MFRRITSFLLLLSATLLCAQPGDFWKRARNIRPGIKLVVLNRNIPLPQEPGKTPATRPLKGLVLRVDLRHREYGFVGLWPDKDHGKPMPDHHPKNGKAPCLIDTLRTTVPEFMRLCRLPKKEGGRGQKVVVAFNSAPWTPWESPYNHKYGMMYGLTISNGILIRDASQKFPRFVVWKNGNAEITDRIIPQEEYKNIWICHFGFGLVTRDGQFVGQDNALQPRTCFGLSRDRRFFYVLTVDGRQPGYSTGATYKDLHDIIFEAGAWDAINMDGGGSTTLCVWNNKEKKADVLSHSTGSGSYCRPNGMNLGIYLKK